MNKLNLFKTSQKWFRHTSYKVVEHPFSNESDTYKAIKPSKKANLKWYNPFDEFPDILDDFYKLAAALNNDREAIKELKEFTELYGPLGLYWEEITFEENYKDNFGNKILYKQYGSNNWRDFLIQKYFMDNYNEVIKFIDMGPIDLFDQNKTHHFNFHSDDYYNHDLFKTHYFNLLKGYGESPLFLKITKLLQYITKNIFNHDNFNISQSLGLTYEEGFAQLSFNCNSLLNAIIVMHFLNKTGNTGKHKVRICEREGCNNSFIVGPSPTAYHPKRKHCPGCANKKRTNKSRYKYGFDHTYYLSKRILPGQMTIKELSEKKSVPKEKIVKAIEEYTPKNDETKKLLKKYKAKNNKI